MKEEVGDVKVDGYRRVDRVVESAWQVHRPIPVVDDVQCEQESPGIVDEGPVVDLGADAEACHEHLSEPNKEECD